MPALSHHKLRGFLKLELPKFDRDYFKFNFFFGGFALIETAWNIFVLGIENNRNKGVQTLLSQLHFASL